MLKSSCLGHTVSTRIVTNIKSCLLFRCNKVKNKNEPFNDFYHIKVCNRVGKKIMIFSRTKLNKFDFFD